MFTLRLLQLMGVVLTVCGFNTFKGPADLKMPKIKAPNIQENSEQLKRKLAELEQTTKRQVATIKELESKHKDAVSNRCDEAQKKLKTKVQELEETIRSLKETQTKCEKKGQEGKTGNMTEKWLVCERKLSLAKIGCPFTFTHDKEAGLCFGLVDKALSFQEAGEFCKRNQKGRLVVLNTQDKLDTVRRALNQSDIHNSVWVGAERNGSDFQWVDSSPVDLQWKGWAPGEPNNEDEKCVDLHDTLQYKMNDLPCYITIPFVCEVVASKEDDGDN